MSKRQCNILNLIVKNYIEFGYPISSKKLLNDIFNISSATIRKDMKILEEYGFLLKKYSSAGRKPTLLGYKYYINKLLKLKFLYLKDNELKKIKNLFIIKFNNINEIIKYSAEILSNLTKSMVFLIGPDIKKCKLTEFKIIKLNNKQILCIIIIDKCNVITKIYNVSLYLFNDNIIKKILLIINKKIIGFSLIDVYYCLRTEFPLILHKYFKYPNYVIELFNDIIIYILKEKVYISGKNNLLNYVYKTRENIKLLYSFFENKKSIIKLLDFFNKKKDIEIKIGNELNNKLLDNMSLIFLKYNINFEHGNGLIALLGPINMNYFKILSIINSFKIELVSKILSYYKNL